MQLNYETLQLHKELSFGTNEIMCFVHVSLGQKASSLHNSHNFNTGMPSCIEKLAWRVKMVRPAEDISPMTEPP